MNSHADGSYTVCAVRIDVRKNWSALDGIRTWYVDRIAIRDQGID